jgi:hypothetical protein
MLLARSVHGVSIGDDMVLLDTRLGEYFCLPDAAAAFATDPRGVRVLDPELADDLATMSLSGAIESHDRSALPALATADLAGLGPARLDHGSWLSGGRAYATMVGRFYGKPFSHIIDYARRHAPDQRLSLLDDDLVDCVAKFRSLLPWAPFPGVCLYRSFLLLAFLRRAGFDATWMFGVRTWSFEAHCWLQIGDTVIDDRADRIVGYTPIMAV